METERDVAETDPAELGNYEGVSGGETTPQSGDPDAEANATPDEREVAPDE